MQTGHTKQYSHDGVDSKRDHDYMVERARGGIGLMITGNRFVHPTSSAGAPKFSWAFLREGIAVDRRITDSVHRHGSTIIAQLNHFGVNGSSDGVDDLRVLWGPSGDVPSPTYNEMPKEMEHEDIEEVTQWWATCAAYSREAGFDGVEIHLSHAYLLHQFISPLYNHRDDEYGGSLENRLRFAREVIDAVRVRVGTDFVVGVRLPLTDAVEGALDLRHAVKIAKLLEDDGKIDFINVTAGGYHDGLYNAIATGDMGEGWLIDKTAEVKAAVRDTPVFVVGGIHGARMAEEILSHGQADMVAMTRAQIAEPAYANKVLQGREQEIYRCIRGNQGCIARSFVGKPIGCTVNPTAGRERVFGYSKIRPADPPGRWIVVGGGPAGLKAAETLARREHQVTLVERDSELGGQVNLIIRTPGRDRFGFLVEDIATHLEKYDVDVCLNKEATPGYITDFDPDGVIVATGASPSRTGFSSIAPLVPTLPGVEQDHVLTVWDALSGYAAEGRKIVVLDDDGSRYTAGTAEVLLDNGADVHVVSRFSELFSATAATLDMGVIYERLFSKGLTHRLNSWARVIGETNVEVYNLFTDEPDEIHDVDAVVLATAPKANAGLYQSLKGDVDNLHRIGDCLAPRKLDHAIYEGYLAGCEITNPQQRYIVEGELEKW